MLRALLNRSQPYPDETLASWLWRLARQNYADSPAWFLPYLRETWSTATKFGLSTANGLRDETALTGIANLTGYSIVEIHRHTLHRFANPFTPPALQVQERVGLSDTTLAFLPARPSKDFYSRNFSWCPSCLAEARYVRFHWHFPGVACCELHRCWLLDCCPQCHTPVAVVDVINGCCGKCNFRLEQAATPPIPAGDRLLQWQATAMDWLYRQVKTLPFGLPDVPVNTLLWMLNGLRYAAQRAGNGWTFHHIPPNIPIPDLDIRELRRLTVFERGCLYATAFRGLQNWPHGLFAYLDAYRSRPGKKEETGLRREFGVLYISWLRRLWKHSSFEFIQEAFNDYLVARVPAFQVVDSSRTVRYPTLLQRVDYLNIYRSACYVGLSSSTIHRLIREGHLTVYRFEQSEGTWLSRHELDQLQRRWENHITTPEAARLLGVSIEVTRDLLKERLLQPVPASEGLKLQLVYLFRDSVAQLIQKLKVHTTIQPNAQQSGVSLTEVCLRNASVGLGFPQLLVRIGDGQLAAFHPNEMLFPLTDLWFPSEAVANLSRVVRAEHRWLNLQETERCLGIRRKALYSLLRTGLLQPVMDFGPKRFFSQTDVLALRDRYTSPHQAAALLNIPTDYLFRLVGHGSIVLLAGVGSSHRAFDRYQLIAWRDEHILYREMKTLTSNVAALRRLLKEQGVHPVVTNPAVYLRKEVMTVLELMPV
jgi:predicted DNA-binding transcriptional regulator AlpA